MKCLNRKNSGTVMPHRYKDRKAADLVATGDYEYCSKERWKKEVRDFVPESQKNKKNKKRSK